MSTTISMDAAGRIVLPRAFREKLALTGRATFEAELVGDKIEMTPQADERVRLVRKGKRLVVTGFPKNFTAVAAIEAAREEHDDRLLSFRRRK